MNQSAMKSDGIAFNRTMKYACASFLVVMLAGCAVGPDYRAPAVDVGASYKQIEGWKMAQPGDASDRGDWWRLFDDPGLDRLMADVLAANLSIAQSEAQFRQAQAALASARSAFFPSLGTSASFSRSGSGGGSATGGDFGGDFSGGSSGPRNQYTLTGTVSWEADLWGRVRRSVESGRAGVEAGAADLANTRLSMQSTLAQTYFRLRAMDEEQRLFEQTVAAYERSLRMTRNRFEAGVAAQAEVAAATAQLENARAQLIDLTWQRAQFEHAIAVLTGRAPSQFSLARRDDVGSLPVIPVGLPSELLERRPDVAAAERRAAAANAQIGVAKAAWFPDLTLSAQGGYRSGQWAQWLTAPFSFWSLGPQLALTIFDGGAREAQVRQARAAYEGQVAAYRLTVLTALREVEDFLVQLRVLAQEQVIQGRALEAARESLRLTQNQYEAGLIDYLSVVQVETTALAAERAALALYANRMIASVQLIAALGGGWQIDQPVLMQAVAQP